MTPLCKIAIDGQLASGVFMSRLISCEVTDKEGIASDSARMELNNWPPAAIPRHGAIVRIWMGYAQGGMVFMGTFTVDEVELSLYPHTMSITAKSADLREKMKENKERHWDDRSVSQIVSDIAADHGLTAKVDGEVGGHVYDWFGQQDESDIHVLRRLERRHDGLFSVKDGQLIFAKRGAGQTSSGRGLSGYVVTPRNLVEGSGKVRFADRAAYKSVKAYHQDRETAERVEIDAPSDSEASAIYRIGEPFADIEEAERAAKSKAKDLKRQGISFACTVFGDPAARAGAPLTFAGMKAGIDGIEFIIETARHSFSKQNYVTALDGKLKV